MAAVAPGSTVIPPAVRVAPLSIKSAFVPPKKTTSGVLTDWSSVVLLPALELWLKSISTWSPL
jgi:hypothetical protein